MLKYLEFRTNKELINIDQIIYIEKRQTAVEFYMNAKNYSGLTECKRINFSSKEDCDEYYATLSEMLQKQEVVTFNIREVMFICGLVLFIGIILGAFLKSLF